MPHTELLAVLKQWDNICFDKVCLRGLQLLQNLNVQKVAIALIAVKILGWTNRALTNYSLNNWARSCPWDNEKELVLVTGGCSGIGKQIVHCLMKRGIRVVVLDIQEPTISLG